MAGEARNPSQAAPAAREPPGLPTPAQANAEARHSPDEFPNGSANSRGLEPGGVTGTSTHARTP
eukprot:9847755-Alexandrium_andersonii.AAC.1